MKMDVDPPAGGAGGAGGAGIALLDRMQQPPPPPDQSAAMQQMLGNFQLSLIETERNREVARQIERADERSHHRVRDEQMAQMTAFNGRMFQDLASRAPVLPIEVALVTNVNIQNVTPSYVTNLQANLYQTTHNLQQNTLNFINNTSNKLMAIGGSLAGKPEEIFQPVMNGGPPPPPRGGERAIRDRDGPYAPSSSSNVPLPLGPPVPLPSGPVPLPLLDKPDKPDTPDKPKPDKPIVIKKPGVIKDKRPPIPPPKKVPPPMIIDIPKRVKPQKNRELLEILDAFGDDPPSKRPKKDEPKEPLAVRIRNRLRIQPA